MDIHIHTTVCSFGGHQAYGYQWMSMDIHIHTTVCSFGGHQAYGYRWMSMDIHIHDRWFVWRTPSLWISMDVHGHPYPYDRLFVWRTTSLWISMDVHGHPYPCNFCSFVGQKTIATYTSRMTHGHRWCAVGTSVPPWPHVCPKHMGECHGGSINYQLNA